MKSTLVCFISFSANSSMAILCLNHWCLCMFFDLGEISFPFFGPTYIEKQIHIKTHSIRRYTHTYIYFYIYHTEIYLLLVYFNLGFWESLKLEKELVSFLLILKVEFMSSIFHPYHLPGSILKTMIWPQTYCSPLSLSLSIVPWPVFLGSC